MLEYKIGDVIGDHYKVVAVAYGFWSVVYVVDLVPKLRRTPLHGTRVLKSFRSAVPWTPKARDIFLREADLWIDLSRRAEHPMRQPFFVRAFAARTIAGCPFLELEYIRGGSLATIPPLPMPQVVDLAVQCCRGLRYLSSLLEGFSHGDIRPSNLLYKRLRDDVLILKITDFGLSKVATALHSPTDVDSADRDPFFHVTYSSPESILHGHNDVRSDVWSVGLVLFELLAAGHLDPRVRAKVMSEIAGRLRRGDQSVMPSCLNLSVPSDLDAVIQRCTRVDPKRRYPRVEDLEAALEAVVTRHKWTPQKDLLAFAGNAFTWDSDYAIDDSLSTQEDGDWAVSAAAVGNRKRAVELFDSALSVSADDTLSMIDKALCLLEGDGDPSEALGLVVVALELDPANANGWTVRGMALHALNANAEALSCYERAIGIDPTFADAWQNKGSLLSNEGQYAEAVGCLQRAAKLRPREPMILHNLALTLEKMGRFNEAADWYKRAAEIDGDVATVASYGHCLVKQQRYAEGEFILWDVIRRDPQYAQAWLYLGSAYYNQCKWPECVDVFEHLGHLDPDLAARHSVEILLADAIRESLRGRPRRR